MVRQLSSDLPSSSITLPSGQSCCASIPGERSGNLKRSLRRVRRLGHGERPEESVKTRCDRIFRAGGPVVCSPVGQLDGEVVDRARGVG
jgi:hypothetical protein